jgi:hypothetical protein
MYGETCTVLAGAARKAALEDSNFQLEETEAFCVEKNLRRLALWQSDPPNRNLHQFHMVFFFEAVYASRTPHRKAMLRRELNPIIRFRMQEMASWSCRETHGAVEVNLTRQPGIDQLGNLRQLSMISLHNGGKPAVWRRARTT